MRFGILYIFVICLFMVISCSPIQQYKVLSFVFDGVPNPMALDGDTSVVEVSNTNVLQPALKNKPIDRVFVHEPFESRNCENCHMQGKSELQEPEPSLCYMCHEDMTEKYTYLHGPVAGGYCTECHNPHKSKIDKLLLREGQSLCLSCHVKTDVLNNENHEGIDEMNCIECHNPHGGEDPFLFQ